MNNVSPGKLTTLIGAAVTFIFSFLPWVSISFGFGKHTANAWSSGMFPMATWAPVFAVIAGFIVAVQAFGFLELPEKLWEFTQDQIVLILSVFTFIITISFLIVDNGGTGFGLILCLLGSIAMIAGFFMHSAGVGANPNAAAGGGATGQTGFAPPQQQAPPQQSPQQQSPQQQAPPQQPQPPQNPGSF